MMVVIVTGHALKLLLIEQRGATWAPVDSRVTAAGLLFKIDESMRQFDAPAIRAPGQVENRPIFQARGMDGHVFVLLSILTVISCVLITGQVAKFATCFHSSCLTGWLWSGALMPVVIRA